MTPKNTDTLHQYSCNTVPVLIFMLIIQLEEVEGFYVEKKSELFPTDCSIRSHTGCSILYCTILYCGTSNPRNALLVIYTRYRYDFFFLHPTKRVLAQQDGIEGEGAEREGGVRPPFRPFILVCHLATPNAS